MRISLEQKIKYLADKGIMYKITKNRTNGKYGILTDEGSYIFIGSSISKAIGEVYKFFADKCTCEENMGCTYCK